MKNYKTLLNEMPSKAIVLAFGRFNPPTTGHELLINKVTQYAQRKRIDYQIWVTHTVDKKKNPLPQDRKLYFMKRMFGSNINFVPTSAPDKRTVIEVLKHLNKKYDELYMIAGSDRINEYRTLITKYNGTDYNFKKIQIISSGKRDPDSDSADGMSATKMREAATKGDFASFKRGIPAKMTIADAKRMFNEVRKGMGLQAVTEQINLNTSEIREQYVAGEIFNIGAVVEDANGVYEVMDRGANYITVVDNEGNLSKKWLNEVTEVSKEIEYESNDFFSYKGYVAESFSDFEEIAEQYKELVKTDCDPVAILNAIKLVDECLNIIKESRERGYATADEVDSFNVSQIKLVDTLAKIGQLDEHVYIDGLAGIMQDLQEKNKEKDASLGIRFTGADRIKVARIIAGALGVDSPEKSSNPSQLVNMGLRKIRTKRVTPEFGAIVTKMLSTAKAAGIEYDEGLLPTVMKKQKEKIVEADAKKDKSQEELTKERIKKEKEMDKVKHDRELDSARLRDARKKNAMTEEKVDKSSTFNIAKSIMSYSDFKKMLGIQGGLEKRDELGELDTDGADHPDVIKRREKKLKRVDEEFESHMMYSPDGDEKMVDSEDEHKKLAAKGWVEDPEDLIKDEDDDDIVKEFDPEKDPLDDEDVLDIYDDDELIIVDDEDEELEESVLFEETELNEVLSRAERIKSKIRMKRTAAKRKRALRIALKKHSSSQVVNRRARRLAVKLIKKRLFKKPAHKMSVGEKERAEARLKKMNKVLNRIAMKLAPKVRKMEKSRLSHKRTK